jgi:transcriptional regulator with XRE-family HTH domain
MRFRDLQQRLLEHLLIQVRNGKMSGRKLSSLTGVSQGHINNVLNGRCPLALDTADRILSHLQLDVRDFIERGELLESLQRR